MALDAVQVETLQNSTPTDWATFDNDQGQTRVTGDANQRFALDDKLHVRFFMKPRYNPDKSAEQNRPIYEDTEIIEIMMPGEKHNIISRPAASMQDHLRFATRYAQFKAGQAEQMVGTPLKVLPFLSEAQVAELDYFKVRTVEQLATLSPNVNFMGANEMKNKAQHFLDSMTSGGKLAEDNKRLQDQLAALTAIVEKMQSAQAAEQASKVPRK